MVFLAPCRGEAFARPLGRGDWIPAMAGAMHPPFSLFLPEEKEKTGRARSKREKEVSPLRGDEGRGDAQGRASVFYACLLPAAWCGRGFWWLTNGPSPLFAAAHLAVGGMRLPFSRTALLSAEHPSHAGGIRTSSGHRSRFPARSGRTSFS